MLQKGVLVIERNNLSGTQPTHVAFIKLIFVHRLDVQVE